MNKLMTQYLFSNQYQRDIHDLYIEQRWCSRHLFEKVKFSKSIHDPSCGTGNIVAMARMMGYQATGADIVDRPTFRSTYNYEVIDYFDDLRIRDNIVSNPPYKKGILERYINHAIHTTTGKIALLVRLAFLEGQDRYRNLYKIHRPALVLVFSTRPSIGPPGANPTGGKTSYCWIIWDKLNTNNKTELDWILE